MQIKDLITPGACESTMAGWIWYCDEHQTHGNADSSDEAEHMIDAHEEFFTYANIQGYIKEEGDPSVADNIDWDDFNGCESFVIDVSNNITYNYGEDYDNKTPNQITDLEKAKEIRDKLGLP